MLAANRFRIGAMSVVRIGITESSKRPPVVVVCLVSMALLLPPPPIFGQSGVSICDDPHYRGTAAYNKYCGACYPHCGNAGNSTNDNGAEAQRRWNAAATAQNQLAIDAEKRGDWAVAEREYKKCLQFWPHDPVILNAIANTQQLEGLAAFKRGDYDAALEFYRESMVNEPPTDKYYQTMLANSNDIRRRIDAIRTKQEQRQQDEQTSQHIDQSIQSFSQSLNATPPPNELDFSDGKRPQKDSKALMQARVAAATAKSADCIFDGGKGCGAPVALVTVDAGSPPVPPDAAKYIESIPKSVREQPAVKADIALYEQMASLRARLQNQMIADAGAARAHPEDESKKLKVMEDSGHVTKAKEDEEKAKQRVGFRIGLLNQPSGAASK